MSTKFIVPIHLSIVTVDYYSTRGNNQYKEYSEDFTSITKGFSRKDCIKNLKLSKYEVSKLTFKISNIRHLKFLSRGVM